MLKLLQQRAKREEKEMLETNKCKQWSDRAHGLINWYYLHMKITFNGCWSELGSPSFHP